MNIYFFGGRLDYDKELDSYIPTVYIIRKDFIIHTDSLGIFLFKQFRYIIIDDTIDAPIMTISYDNISHFSSASNSIILDNVVILANYKKESKSYISDTLLVNPKDVSIIIYNLHTIYNLLYSYANTIYKKSYIDSYHIIESTDIDYLTNYFTSLSYTIQSYIDYKSSYEKSNLDSEFKYNLFETRNHNYIFTLDNNILILDNTESIVNLNFFALLLQLNSYFKNFGISFITTSSYYLDNASLQLKDSRYTIKLGKFNNQTYIALDILDIMNDYFPLFTLSYDDPFNINIRDTMTTLYAYLIKEIKQLIYNLYN